MGGTRHSKPGGLARPHPDALSLCLLAVVLVGCAREHAIDFGGGSISPDDLALQQAVQQAIDRAPERDGNDVVLLRDGGQTLPAMFAALKHAKDSINLEYYTFENVRRGGETLGDILVDRLRHGIAVSILYDSFGSSDIEAAFRDRLAAAGAAITVFNPHPLARGWFDSPQNRDHRKIMVIDGRIAFMGGVNLDHVYENSIRPGSVPDDPDDAYWRDTAIRIEGPSVADLQRVFFDTWSRQHGVALPRRDWFPAMRTKGKQSIRILASAPGEDQPLYYTWLLRALHAARQSISLSTGFFVPTHQQREELAKAARRGVRVRLLLPSRGDSRDAIAAGRAAYGDLLAAGVKIHEVQNMVLHAKFVIVDDVLVIGSSNFDYRSAIFNNEVDAILPGSITAKGNALFEQDIGLAREVDLPGWRARPIQERLREWRARFLELFL